LIVRPGRSRISACRRPDHDYERLSEHSEAMVHWSTGPLVHDRRHGPPPRTSTRPQALAATRPRPTQDLKHVLTQDDRIEIADGLKDGEPVKSIAARIGKNYQSVYREIARNKKPDGRYQPWYAHTQAHQRRRRPRTARITTHAALRAAIAGKLEKHWSPAQISRWLRRRWPRRPGWYLCHETIYAAVYRSLIVVTDLQTLRTGRTYRRKRGRGRSRDGSLKQSTNMRSIHQRPVIVAERAQVGHWEGDLVVGAMQRSAVATLVDRRTRRTLLVPIRGGHSAQNVGDALVAVFAGLPPALRRTLTWDQGNEMFHHEQIESAIGIRIYFAAPHSPWQRPTNENTNGLLR
jgi:transposase, IS30 family